MDVDIHAESNMVAEQQSSFGIEKIIDCKIDEVGRQMYKVKWEPTWEPAENLASCQHLVDNFWSFVNKAKTNEELARQHRKRLALEQGKNNLRSGIEPSFNRMSDDEKTRVKELIVRASATSVGSQLIMSPSDLLIASSLQNNEHFNTMGMTQPPAKKKTLNYGIGGSGQQNFDAHMQKEKCAVTGSKGNISAPSAKVKTDDMLDIDSKVVTEPKTSAASNAASFKYIENFSNPYVKIIIVCKICNKEAAKNPGNWKVHYLTHLSNEEKPHKCPVCNQGFVQTNNLKRHMKKHAKAQGLGHDGPEIGQDYDSNIKNEYFF